MGCGTVAETSAGMSVGRSSVAGGRDKGTIVLMVSVAYQAVAATCSACVACKTDTDAGTAETVRWET